MILNISLFPYRYYTRVTKKNQHFFQFFILLYFSVHEQRRGL